MNKNSFKIYIILTQTYSIVSRIISLFSKSKYSHVSISLDKKCDKMYSFGRKVDYFAFIGSFKEENINKGLFLKSNKSLMALYELNVTLAQYKKIKEKINEIKENSDGYNLIGVVLVPFNVKLRRNKYYCSEFVNEVLESVGIKIDNSFNKVVKPEDFISIKGIKLLYEGKICDYIKNI